MNKALVTGATGFLGRAVVRALAGRGFEVHGVARSVRPDGAEATLHGADLLTDAGRERILMVVRPSHLVHLAWEARPGRYRDDPGNFDWAAASSDLFARASSIGVERILGIGSCLEYGPCSGPCDETSTACHPATLYGQAKLAASQTLLAADAGAVWGRVFFPFGPYEPEDRLIPSLIRSLLAGRTFNCSQGEQLRDFIYIEDLAHAIVAVLESDLTGVVNLGSGEPRSLRSVVEYFSTRLGKTGQVRFGAVEATGVDAEPIIAADVGRLRSVTGHVPVVGFQEGAERDLAWWIDRLSGRA